MTYTTSNWNNFKNKLEHQKYIKNKYYNKIDRKRISTFKTKSNKRLEWFTSDIEASNSESLIMCALDNLNIAYFREVSFEGFKTGRGGHYRYDFFIPHKNILIEYDGREYHKNNPNDLSKTMFAKKHKIKLIRLNYKHYYIFDKVLKDIFNK